MLYQKRYVKEIEYRTLYYGLVTIIGYITTFVFSVGLTHALCGSPLWCPSQHTQFPLQAYRITPQASWHSCASLFPRPMSACLLALLPLHGLLMYHNVNELFCDGSGTPALFVASLTPSARLSSSLRFRCLFRS